MIRTFEFDIIIIFFFCRVDIEETIVNGSFNMMFLGHSISLTYRDHINVIMRFDD